MDATTMKWLSTKCWTARVRIVCLLLIYIGTPARGQSVKDSVNNLEVMARLQVSAMADSTVVVWIDSATTVRLPYSVITKAIEDSATGTISTDKAQEPTTTAYDRRRQRAARRWEKLIPNQITLQYAGSIGLLSAGIGWHYGKHDHWESEFLIGFLPRYQSDEVSSTFTLKQRYVPWHCHVHRRWTLEPLTTGFFFNFIGGEDFWAKQPERYPKHYYGFSTKVRTHIYIGQRVRFNIPRNRRFLHQAVSLYYEISTCDLYLVSKITNKDFPWRETLSLALGLRLEM